MRTAACYDYADKHSVIFELVPDGDNEIVTMSVDDHPIVQFGAETLLEAMMRLYDDEMPEELSMNDTYFEEKKCPQPLI